MPTFEGPQPVALPLYTIADAAEAIGVSTAFMYDRIRENKIASVDLGQGGGRQKLRIPADALQTFLQERLTSPDLSAVAGDAA
ncbi:helix-turn-helix domain-containing protein [Arthrobacter sp. UYCu712]|uniref:helix-turn-helix domain-containing protein n=1 Tax=Arthrobacter sp. UYCu712 TaxID=3156340 RepID=UPI00339614B6